MTLDGTLALAMAALIVVLPACSRSGSQPAPSTPAPAAAPRTSQPGATPPATGAPQTSAPQPAPKPAPAAPPSAQPPAAAAKPVEEPPRQPVAVPPANEPLAYVILSTSLGDIVLELDREKAPKSVANFLSYVDKQFYHGTVFHRVMANFMIQGGGFDQSGKQKPTDPPVVNEWRNGLKNVRGSIAMARLGGKPDSATSQFFINVVDNPALDMARDGAAYAVFGRVYAGMDVVDAIRHVTVQPNAGGEPSQPVDPPVITEARQITSEQAKQRAEMEKQTGGG
jgi:cyclophilin family peptidyl-prolyl cis-trans isomerase